MLGALKELFRPEFLNRVDEIVAFDSLTNEQLLQIVELMLEDTKKALQNKNISLEMNENTIKVIRINDEPANRSLHGLTRTLINNMIIGVTQEYTRELQINGVGYRVAKQGNNLNLTLGYCKEIRL